MASPFNLRRRCPVAFRFAGWGTLAVVVYALVAAAQILVWNPLAAAPGRSLSQITADMAAAGESLDAPIVAGTLLVGPLVMLAVWRKAARGTVTARTTLTTALAMLVLGTPAYWVASFGPGMALADTYFTTGGDHAPWAIALHVVSSVALIGLAVLAAARHHPVPATARLS